LIFMAANGSNGQGTFGTPLTQLAPVTRGGPPLVDQYGRPIPDADARAFGPPTDPIRDSATAGVVKRDIPIALITRWTPDLIQNALDQHMLGNFTQSAFLCDAMTGDDRISATLGQRMGALFSRPMKTTPCMNGVESSDAEAVAVADAWTAAWDRMAPLSVLEEVHTWGITESIVPVEVQWDRSVTPWQPYLKPWHPTHLMWRWDLRKFTIVTMDGIEVIEPGDGRWMLYTPHGPWRGWRRAAVRPLAMPWYVRQLSWRDHARYNERHGMPILKAKAPARSDPTLRDRWVHGLSQLGQESVVLCPQNVDGTGFDIEMLEARDRAWESFGALASRADMAIVLAILWQNLTSEVTGGSYAAAAVHEGVQTTGSRYDDATLSACLFEQVARPFAAWNFGRPELAPKRSWVIDQPADHLTSAQTFSAFGQAISGLFAAGIKLTPAGVALLAHRFNLPLDAGQIQEVAPAVAAGEPPPKDVP
jgi:phage gp29-like protein